MALIEAIRKPDFGALRDIGDVHPVDILGPSAEALKGWPKPSTVNARKAAEELLKNESQLQFKIPDHTEPTEAVLKLDNAKASKPRKSRKKSKPKGEESVQG